MADDDTYRGMNKVSRPVHGPRPVAALVPLVARTALNSCAPGISGLLQAWPEIVGPVLAAASMPRRMAKGTLTIACSGPMAMQLQYVAPELMDRINRYHGSQAVRSLRFVQTLLASPFTRPGLADATVSDAVTAAVATLPEGPLRSALRELGIAVHGESTSRLGKQPRTRC